MASTTSFDSMPWDDALPRPRALPKNVRRALQRDTPRVPAKVLRRRWEKASAEYLAEIEAFPTDRRAALHDLLLRSDHDPDLTPEHVMTRYNVSCMTTDDRKNLSERLRDDDLRRGITKGRRDSDIEATKAMVWKSVYIILCPLVWTYQQVPKGIRWIHSALRGVGAKFLVISNSSVAGLLGDGVYAVWMNIWWVSAAVIAIFFTLLGRWVGSVTGNATAMEMLPALSPLMTMVVLITSHDKPRWGRMLAATIVGVMAGTDLWERGSREFFRLADFWHAIPNYGPLPLWPQFVYYLLPVLKSVDTTTVGCMIQGLLTLAFIRGYIGKEG